MQLGELTRWSRRHSVTALAAMLVGVAGVVLRSVPTAAHAGRAVLVAASVAGLAGALLSWTRAGPRGAAAAATPWPAAVRDASRERGRQVIALVRRARPLDRADRELVEYMAPSHVRGQATQVWAPVLIIGSAADGLSPLDPRAPLWWVSVVLTLAASGLELVAQHDGFR